MLSVFPASHIIHCALTHIRISVFIDDADKESRVSSINIDYGKLIS